MVFQVGCGTWIKRRVKLENHITIHLEKGKDFSQEDHVALKASPLCHHVSTMKEDSIKRNQLGSLACIRGVHHNLTRSLFRGSRNLQELQEDQGRVTQLEWMRSCIRREFSGACI